MPLPPGNETIAGSLMLVDEDGRYFLGSLQNDVVIYANNSSNQRLLLGVNDPSKPAQLVITSNQTFLQTVDVAGPLSVHGDVHFMQPLEVQNIVSSNDVTINGISVNNSNIYASDGYFEYIYSSNAVFEETDVQDLWTGVATICNASVMHLTASNAHLSNMYADDANISNIWADWATIETLIVEHLNTSNIAADKAYLKELYVETSSTSNMMAFESHFSNLAASNASIFEASMSNVHACNLYTSNFETINLDVIDATFSNLTGSNAYIGHSTFSNVISSNVHTHFASISNLETSNAVVVSASFSNIHSSNAYYNFASISNLETSNAVLTSATFSNIQSSNAYIGHGTFSNIATSNAYFDHASFSNLETSNAVVITAAFSNIESSNAHISHGTFSNVASSNAHISHGTFSNVASSNVQTIYASFSNIAGSNASIGLGTFSNIAGSNATLCNASIIDASLINLYSSNAHLSNLTVNHLATFSNISTSNLTASNITAPWYIGSNVTASNLTIKDRGTFSNIVASNVTVATSFTAQSNAYFLKDTRTSNLSSSNLAIGKNIASYPLDVIGDVNFTGTLRQGGAPFKSSQFTTCNNNIFITHSNVGIGTSNWQSFNRSLTVAGGMTVDTISSFTTNNITASNVNVTGDFMINNTPIQFLGDGGGGGGDSQFTTNLTGDAVYIVNSNVGIGLIDPRSRLHVKGSTTLDGDVTISKPVQMTGIAIKQRPEDLEDEELYNLTLHEALEGYEYTSDEFSLIIGSNQEQLAIRDELTMDELIVVKRDGLYVTGEIFKNGAPLNFDSSILDSLSNLSNLNGLVGYNATVSGTTFSLLGQDPGVKYSFQDSNSQELMSIKRADVNEGSAGVGGSIMTSNVNAMSVSCFMVKAQGGLRLGGTAPTGIVSFPNGSPFMATPVTSLSLINMTACNGYVEDMASGTMTAENGIRVGGSWSFLNTNALPSSSPYVLAFGGNGNAADVNLSAGNTIPFAGKDQDAHDSWNTTSYVFTAPWNGKYSLCVSAHVKVNAGGSSNRIYAVKNNTEEYVITGITGTSEYRNGSVVLKLDAGDTIEFKVMGECTLGMAANGGTETYATIAFMS